MKSLEISFKKCFGINKLNYNFNFSKNVNDKDDGSINNSVIIYAKNGIMKTSFTKTFKLLSENIQKFNRFLTTISNLNNERALKNVKKYINIGIKDNIFYLNGECDLKVDNLDLQQSVQKLNSICVIKSFDTEYKTNSLIYLLVNEGIKGKINSLVKNKTMVLQRLLYLYEYERLSRFLKYKIDKHIDELETKIIEDFNLNNSKEIFAYLDVIDNYLKSDFFIKNKLDFYDAKYKDIFNLRVIKFIEDPIFKDNISEFINDVDNIYNKYPFLCKGKLTLNALKKIKDNLKSNYFFEKNNRICLNNYVKKYNLNKLDNKKFRSKYDELFSINELENIISEIEDEIKKTKFMSKIEKISSRIGEDILEKFKNIIIQNTKIIDFLNNNSTSELKKMFWASHLYENDEFKNFLSEYKKLSKIIKNTNHNITIWEEALDVFKQRFSVPFNMEISNKQDIVIGTSSLPKVTFKFEEKIGGKFQNLSHEEVVKADTLSQGEKKSFIFTSNNFWYRKIKKRKN
ncbi:hypothetical protein [Ureaplasma ceti]|uniref:Uncharacterized protein n=1 Tax=Ureaplasma ceti TaxID=3119530 RepID=A0ABP9U4V4_9BACT